MLMTERDRITQEIKSLTDKLGTTAPPWCRFSRK